MYTVTQDGVISQTIRNIAFGLSPSEPMEQWTKYTGNTMS